MDIEFELETQHLFLIERTCVVCGKQKNLIADFYKCRPDATKISSYAYECKECTRDRVREYENKIVKVIVRKKTDTRKFEKFIDKLYSAGVADLKIVENFQLQESEDFEVEESEDTMSILERYIEESETELDKAFIKSLMKTTYQEACEMI
mgnify:CR=1 FL=1